MTEDELSARGKERDIMILMRKTLAAIIRDVTPLPGMKSPLQDATVESIRYCLGVIAQREQEIARAEGREIGDRPRYIDQASRSQVIDFKPFQKDETES